MKPISLVMEAFGPFEGRQTIDFGALGDRRLFLIEGDTGSGKTTIFDAICAALYGKTSVGRSPEHMKCLSADAKAECRLEFTFQVGTRSFRIEQIPKQDRPSRRGGGVTSRARSATLWETTSGTDHVLATKVEAVLERIETIVGLSAEQFCQVVLLPQGRFENMLKAPAQDREKVMKVLFQTERYEAIQKQLSADAEKAETEVKETLLLRNQILQSAGCSTSDELSQRHQQIQKEIAKAKIARDLIGIETTKARSALEAGREVGRKLAERALAEKSVQDLQKQEPDANATREECKRADHALHIEATDANLSESIKTASEATERLQGKTILLEAARLEKFQADEKLKFEEKRRPEQDRVQAELSRLEAFENVVAELTGLGTTVTSTQDETDKRTSKLQSAEERLATCTEILQAAEKRHTEQEQVALTLEERRKSLIAAEDAQKKSKQAEELRETLRDLNDQISVACKKQEQAELGVKKARAEFATAQADWIKAQAAVLAKALTLGEPCPVCGSNEHPNPAKLGQGTIDHEKFEQLQAAVGEAEKALDHERTVASALKSTFENAAGREQALTDGKGAAVTTVEEELNETRTLFEKAETAKNSLPKLVSEITRQRDEVLQCTQEYEVLRVAVQEIKDDLTIAKTRLGQREEDIPEPHRDPMVLRQSTENARSQLESLRNALKQAEEAARLAGEKFARQSEAVASAKETSEKAMQQEAIFRKKLVQEIAAEGFTSESDYRTAKRSRQEVKILQEKVTRFENDLATERGRLLRATDAARDLEAQDLSALEASEKDLLQRLQAADTQIGALENDNTTMSANFKRLLELQKDLAGREGRSSALRRLANVAEGKEPRNPGFHRFVLAERLDEVLLAANRRLGPMSGERYRLERVREEENQKVTAGLNLEVLDGYSGKARPVDTLSGGESFLAALSLALGLADVVQQHAGGVKLDTVFVDEGFGSLDPNALELAMRCLEDLGQTGRLVGVISHVAEMKERIRDAQLRVTNTHGVSEAHFVVR